VSRPRYQILVIDDEIGRVGDHREEFLKRSGYEATEISFCSGQDELGRNNLAVVIEQVRGLWEGALERRLSLVLLDVRFREKTDVVAGSRFGFAVLRALRDSFGRTLPIVMLTGVNEARGEANASEADGFLPKEELTPESLAAQLFRNGLYPETGAGLLGVAPKFLLTLREVRRVVASGLREILLLGETGTGKSELARYIHEISNRTGRLEPWFGRRANAELHYDQLFGHWRGAHDGANEHRAGAAERAHNGTLFLDEIAELGPDTQTDLLEYRQRGQDGLRRIRRLGNAPEAARRGETRGLDLSGEYSLSEDRVLVETMLISATNRPIDSQTWREDAGFRQDVVNRLGHRIHLPPLRERAEDICFLFMEKIGALGRSITLTPGAQALLERHEWREGNIAELRVVAEAVIAKLGPDFVEVHPHHLNGLLMRNQGGRGEIHEAEGQDKPSDVVSLRMSQEVSFIDIEVRSLWNLAELLRSSVIATRRPTGLGSLSDILKQVTGVHYAPTDVKREVKAILEPWFAPNARQKARWIAHAAYTTESDQIQADPILSSLYRYSVGEIQWDEAKEIVLKVLER